MTPYKKRSCPITQRLAEDLMIRSMADATIDAYTYHVRRLADFITKPLDRVTPEDVRTFQLHLIQDKNLAYSTFNQAVCALRFYYRHTEPTGSSIARPDRCCSRARRRTNRMPTRRFAKR